MATKSFSYFYGLSILDALDYRATPTASQTKKIELRDKTIEMMNSPQTTPFLAYQHEVDAYFGDRYAAKLFTLVHKLYQVAHAHMLQRATNGPFDIHPDEFDAFLTQRVRYVMIDGEPPASDSDEDDDENDPDWQPN
jgi:hypothetical protein